MPKRQKHKHHRAKGAPQTLAGLGSEGWRAHIEALLARGQTREAVEAAKQYLKEAPGPEAEALAVEAYQARIQALDGERYASGSPGAGVAGQRTVSRRSGASGAIHSPE